LIPDLDFSQLRQATTFGNLRFLSWGETMPDEPSTVKCPLCGHELCEVLDVGTDADIAIPAPGQTPRQRIHAKCSECGVEFYVTNVGKEPD
jgi:hypothetical protein